MQGPVAPEDSIGNYLVKYLHSVVGRAADDYQRQQHPPWVEEDSKDGEEGGVSDGDGGDSVFSDTATGIPQDGSAQAEATSADVSEKAPQNDNCSEDASAT